MKRSSNATMLTTWLRRVHVIRYGCGGQNKKKQNKKIDERETDFSAAVVNNNWTATVMALFLLQKNSMSIMDDSRTGKRLTLRGTANLALSWIAVASAIQLLYSMELYTFRFFDSLSTSAKSAHLSPQDWAVCRSNLASRMDWFALIYSWCCMINTEGQ